MHDPICDELYKITHRNHPVSVWVRTSLENYTWTLDLVDEMQREWQYRYNHTKEHKSYRLAQLLRQNPPANFPEVGLTAFAKAMPDIYKQIDDPVEAYKAYYRSDDKRKIASWKRRSVPEWF